MKISDVDRKSFALFRTQCRRAAVSLDRRVRMETTSAAMAFHACPFVRVPVEESAFSEDVLAFGECERHRKTATSVAIGDGSGNAAT